MRGAFIGSAPARFHAQGDANPWRMCQMDAAAVAQIARPQHQRARRGRDGAAFVEVRIAFEGERVEADARVVERDVACPAVAAQPGKLGSRGRIDEVKPREIGAGLVAELAILPEAERLQAPDEPPSGRAAERGVLAPLRERGVDPCMQPGDGRMLPVEEVALDAGRRGEGGQRAVRLFRARQRELADPGRPQRDDFVSGRFYCCAP